MKIRTSNKFLFVDGGRIHQADVPEAGAVPGPGAFVRVQGNGFVLGNKRFVFDGMNSPFLMDQAARGRRDLVLGTLDEIASSGATVVRTWGFATSGRPLQLAPGVYNEAKLEGLDFAIAAIGSRGLKVVIPFTDNWTNLDGIDKYVKWSPTATKHQDFFTDPGARTLFKNHIAFLLTRRNSITGVYYKDDPTIATWNLVNEPRCLDCPLSAMNNWIREMSDFVRATGAKQLITTGEEGFFRSGAPQNLAKWMNRQGQDFVLNHAHPNINYAVYHFWPDNWFKGLPSEDRLTTMDRWMRDRIAAASTLRKPVVFSEFGKEINVDGGTDEERKRFFELAFAITAESEAEGGPQQGFMFWVFGQGLRQSLNTNRFLVSPTSLTYQAAVEFFKRNAA
eukprot:jgi/Mesvir1/7834/Mv11774-RA.1